MVPESMSDDQAQTCFNLGMATFLNTYKGGVITSYATKDGISNIVFYDKEGMAVLEFIKSICNNKNNGR